jgi:hypothetical protein
MPVSSTKLKGKLKLEVEVQELLEAVPKIQRVEGSFNIDVPQDLIVIEVQSLIANTRHILPQQVPESSDDVELVINFKRFKKAPNGVQAVPMAVLPAREIEQRF